MKITKAVVGLLLSAAVLFSGTDSYGQPGGPKGGGAGPGMKPEVNAAMMRLFGKAAAFSSKAEMTISEGTLKNIVMTVEMAVLDGNTRTEMDMSTVKGMQ